MLADKHHFITTFNGRFTSRFWSGEANDPFGHDALPLSAWRQKNHLWHSYLA